MKLFKMFGIDILNHNQTKSIFIFTTKCLMRMAWFMFLCILISETFLKFKYKENSKELFVRSALFLGSYLMWNYIIKREAKLTETIKKLRKLETLLKISHLEKTVKFCYLLFTTICILIVCVDAYCYHSLTERAMRIFTFGTVKVHDVDWSIALLFVIILQFTLHYEYFLVQYFGIFFVIVCRYMVLILSRHVEKNQHIIKRQFVTSEHSKICFIRYDAILSVFDVLNSILGFPIFLVSSYSACEILLSALKIWESAHGVSLRDITFLLSSFILFTAITFSASDVNEVDKRAKKSNIKILRSLSNKDRIQIKENIEGLPQMCYSPAFALTGWNIFEFTRSFYVTAVGCFVTYSLLIINL